MKYFYVENLGEAAPFSRVVWRRYVTERNYAEAFTAKYFLNNWMESF